MSYSPECVVSLDDGKVPEAAAVSPSRFLSGYDYTWKVPMVSFVKIPRPVTN